jgi:3-hydroxy-9,10-secoandrosta-1,3,5(10)-triene-9,17-dione monooxygenase
MPDTAAPDISPTLEDIRARAEALVDGFRARAAETENNRVLPRQTVEELYDAELLQLFAPKRYGGLSLDWPAIVHASRIAARGCASTGWLISVVGGHIAIVSRLPKACQDEVFKDGVRKIITTASAQTTGTITKEKDGYRLNGVWRFGSGIDHADYVMVTGSCDNHPNPPEPNVFRATVPRDAVEVDDTWHVAGMRGTGSKDLRFENVFVPDDWVVTSPDCFGMHPAGAEVNPEAYLFDVPFMPYFTNWMIGPLLGCAEGAFEAYVAATRKKVGAMSKITVADQPTVQERLAESSAELDCARMMFDAITNTLHSAGLERRALTPEENVQINRNRAYLARLCTNAIYRLVRVMGATGIFDTNPVQRHWRDLSVMASQVSVNWDQNMTTYGRYLLGLDYGKAKTDHAPSENSPKK